jgi:transcriptional repressor NrdR
MKCPYCLSPETKVIDSRPAEENQAIRRRRECPICQNRFTTYERYETEPITVVKRNGSRELFRREKVMAGLLKACEKREVSTEILNHIITEVEVLLQKRGKTEVPSSEIGELVFQKLKEVDRVAYVRFASVYKDFRDIDQFRNLVEELRQGGK